MRYHLLDQLHEKSINHEVIINSRFVAHWTHPLKSRLIVLKRQCHKFFAKQLNPQLLNNCMNQVCIYWSCVFAVIFACKLVFFFYSTQSSFKHVRKKQCCGSASIIMRMRIRDKKKCPYGSRFQGVKTKKEKLHQKNFN